MHLRVVLSLQTVESGGRSPNRLFLSHPGNISVSGCSGVNSQPFIRKAVRLPNSSLEIDLPEDQVAEIAPHIIPEQHLDVFKFSGENGVCDGMYYLNELYGLVCEFPTAGNLHESQLRVGLGLLNAPIVISVSDERYRVWVQLRLPQMGIVFLSGSPVCKTLANGGADRKIADSGDSSSHHSTNQPTASAIATGHSSVSNGLEHQEAGRQEASRQQETSQEAGTKTPAQKAVAQPVVIPPVPMSIPRVSTPPKMPEPLPHGLARNAAVLTQDAPPSAPIAAAPPPAPTIHMFQPTSRTFSAGNGVDLSDWVSASLKAGYRNLLVDLRNVSFMDSSGLAALTTALRLVKQAGGRFALCSLSGQTRMLLEMTNTDQLFEVYTNRQAFEAVLKA